MKRIDPATVDRILDAANIVEVVGDFVSLKKRGTNYIGLCPFHNERTPSFSVSPSKGICKCFSCGKGGSAVNFIMEIEQLSYNEALRYLAKKYHIEIPEKEETEEERKIRTERESLFAANEFAAKHFENNLLNTQQGRDIGLSYFRERGINDAMVCKFHLGYALDRPDDLYNAIRQYGYKEEYFLTTGLLAKNDRGNVYDRFKGRVIYPVHTVSGRVVAFGGRTLKSDKQTAKYVNSPESSIYSKSNQLYGLFQAKQAIAKLDRCIMVEGYMDVISMHQIGIENVVASSGTSLTEGQIRMIRRFSKKVTLIYDSDAAGIKASLRGVDLLLAEGMEIKVLQLPEGEDPDTFAQSHTQEEVLEYIKKNEEDFVLFKSRILLADAGNDPIRRASVINDILTSIAVIPDQVVRSVYVGECSRRFGMKEDVLMLQLGKKIAQRLESLTADVKRAKEIKNIPKNEIPSSDKIQNSVDIKPFESTSEDKPTAKLSPEETRKLNYIHKFEKPLAQLMIRYGFIGVATSDGEKGDEEKTVFEIINDEMEYHGMEFITPVYRKIVKSLDNVIRNRWPVDLKEQKDLLEKTRNTNLVQGMEDIRVKARSVEEIKRFESALVERLQSEYASNLFEFTSNYTCRIFTSSPDDELRVTATELVFQPHKLSKVHFRGAHVITEEERLADIMVKHIYTLKDAHLAFDLILLREKLGQMINTAGDNEAYDSTNQIVKTLERIAEITEMRKELAKFLGERTITA